MADAFPKREPRTVEVPITVKVYHPDTLFFREELVTGKDPESGEDIEVSSVIGKGAIVVRVGAGEWFAFGPRELITAALASREAAPTTEGET